MGVYGRIYIAALALLLVSAKAFAGGTLHNYAPDGTPTWASDPGSQECGHRCLYLESVEKISVMSRHTIETINQMKGLKDDSDGEKAMNQIIPGICDFNGSNPEKVSECQIRWAKTQLPSLEQDRIAIRMNSASAGALGNGEVPAITVNNLTTIDPSRPAQAPKSGFPMSAASVDYTPRQPIVTSMEQYTDIRNRALAKTYNDPYLNNPTAMRHDLEKQTNVHLEDYVKTREILKDPSDPKAGTYKVVVTKPDGKPDYDFKAFQKAQRNQINFLSLKPEEKKRLEENLKNLAKIHQQQLNPSTKNKEIYSNVRTSVLGSARRALDKYHVPYTSGGAAAPAPLKPGAAKGPTPASARSQLSARGVTDTTVGRATTKAGDDQDINVQAQAGPGTRPFFTVGYDDNVLAGEINAIGKTINDKWEP